MSDTTRWISDASYTLGLTPDDMRLPEEMANAWLRAYRNI